MNIYKHVNSRKEIYAFVVTEAKERGAGRSVGKDEKRRS